MTIVKRKVDIIQNISYYMPRILSIRIHGREEYICEVKQNISQPLKLKFTKMTNSTFINNNSIEENIKYCSKLINLISKKRSDERNEWMTVGWALFNISKGSKEGYDLWIKFSQQCPDKFSETGCVYEWQKMTYKEDGLNIGTIIKYARDDNPEEFKKLSIERLEDKVEQSLNGSHHDIALLMKHSDYGSDFICASVKRQEWYEFKNHCWNKIEDGIKLRMKISTDIYKLFKKKYNEFRTKWAEASDADDEGEKAKFNTKMKQIEKTLGNLKSAPSKTNIMKEAGEVFYDGEFNKKLNSNPWKIGFKNGVFDLKENIFREGLPDDYISLQLGVEYNEQLNEDDESVKKC